MLTHLLTKKQIKLTSFSSGDKLFAFIRAFYGLKDLPNFFTKQMSSFFKTIFHQGFAFKYIDDILLLSNSEEHMFQLIEQLPVISTKHNIELVPEKSFFIWNTSVLASYKKVISNNHPQEQKLSTLDREHLGIVHAIQIHEFLIIGYPHPFHIFTVKITNLFYIVLQRKETSVHDFIVPKCN